MSKPPVCRTYQGGAAHGMAELGADDALDDYTDGVAFSGASVGSLLALARAFAVPRPRVRAAMAHALTDNRLLDLHPSAGARGGACLGRVLRDLVADLIGPRVRLGDAAFPVVVGATSLDPRERGPRYLSKRDTPHVLVIDTVVGCHFPGVFAAAPIPSLSGSDLVPDVRLHTDLGAGDNTTDHLWDAPHWPPRVHLRLVGADVVSDDAARIHPGEIDEIALAIFDVVASGASNIKSKRSDGLVINVPRIGNGLCFDERREVLDARYNAGAAAVHAVSHHLATLGADVYRG